MIFFQNLGTDHGGVVYKTFFFVVINGGIIPWADLLLLTDL